jgi:hypothetical protein
MDARAHRVAKRHMESGDYGRKILPVPPGFFTLPAWHTAALEARERRTARFNSFLKRAWPQGPSYAELVTLPALAKVGIHLR